MVLVEQDQWIAESIQAIGLTWVAARASVTILARCIYSLQRVRRDFDQNAGRQRVFTLTFKSQVPLPRIGTGDRVWHSLLRQVCQHSGARTDEGECFA